MKKIVIVAFDEFTDIDVFLPWDLFNRLPKDTREVKIIADGESVTSMTGLTIPTHGGLEEIKGADAVFFASGPSTRRLCKDEQFLSMLELDPNRQLIGSMCSGALLLAGKGLLNNVKATTYPTAKEALKAFGIEVVDEPFVCNGNVATAAGCLAAQDLVGWMVEQMFDSKMRDDVLNQIQPVGKTIEIPN